MPKKFEPTPELLNIILTRYNETKNYSLVSRETGISTAIIQRLVAENSFNIGKRIFQYTGIAPLEGTTPISKNMFYYQLMELTKEKIENV